MRFGFSTVRAADFDRLGAAEVVGRVRERAGDAPVYLSVDIDVLDPAFAPGTGTPEIGGFTSLAAATVIYDVIAVMAAAQGSPRG